MVNSRLSLKVNFKFTVIANLVFVKYKKQKICKSNHEFATRLFLEKNFRNLLNKIGYQPCRKFSDFTK